VAKNLKPYELVAVSPSRAIPYLKSQVDQRKTQLDNAKQQTQALLECAGVGEICPARAAHLPGRITPDEVRSIVL